MGKKGTSDNLTSGNLEDVEKELEKENIRLLAAQYKLKPKSIKKTYDSKIETAASETKESLKTIAGELDTDIKGQFSKMIQQAIKDKASGYDNL
ncbi:hypothetical protein ACVR0S_09800 [Streptococcus dentapri]|uniref:Uncharacterized protein n=1 Tax=Streptococcus dentapri TaxID=573564 RepID=A0ABV8D3A9_9STRE